MAAALLLIYRGRRNQALRNLKQTEDALSLTVAERRKIEGFAAERSKLVQEGIAQQIDSAAGAADEGDVPITDALSAAHSSIRRYNVRTLIPFLVSWAKHQAVKDTYQRVQVDDESATQAQDWQWTQFSDYGDECQTAAAMGAAPLSDILAVTGSWPPIHSRCQCSLEPV
jgi:hypothetical protein